MQKNNAPVTGTVVATPTGTSRAGQVVAGDRVIFTAYGDHLGREVAYNGVLHVLVKTRDILAFIDRG